nr:DUF3828 domain-containing protein [Dyella mobilis]
MAAVLLICALSPRFSVAMGAPTPEADVKAFYAWYVPLTAQLKNPLIDDHIYAYVEKKTIDALRDDYKHDKLPGDTDYFTKVQDFDEKDWASHVVIRPPITLDNVAVILATFGSGATKSNIVIFLRQQGGTWKIMKVEDTDDPF